MERVKKAILLSLASPSDEHGGRGRFHVLLSGDPATAKSEIRTWVWRKLGAETVSQRSTKVGLTGDASGGAITPGALPRADGGVLTIDELDKFKNSDRHGLLEAMSEGVVNVEAGGKTAEFVARCRVVACANTTENFSPELLDGFDFYFELEIPNAKEQRRIVNKIIEGWFREKPDYEGAELRDFLK